MALKLHLQLPVSLGWETPTTALPELCYAAGTQGARCVAQALLGMAAVYVAPRLARDLPALGAALRLPACPTALRPAAAQLAQHPAAALTAAYGLLAGGAPGLAWDGRLDWPAGVLVGLGALYLTFEAGLRRDFPATFARPPVAPAAPAAPAAPRGGRALRDAVGAFAAGLGAWTLCRAAGTCVAR